METFKQHLKSISRNLRDAENHLNDKGMSFPNFIPELEEVDKIQLPYGLFRTANEFRNEYKLYEILGTAPIKNNISYALQASDFFNFLINRFNIGLSIGQIIYKYAIINTVSIIEAILYGTVNSLHDCCVSEESVCRRNARCIFYLKKANKYTFNQMITVLEDKNLITFTEAEKTALKQLKELRDKIHIWETTESELDEESYSIRNYNISIIILRKIKENLYTNFCIFKHSRYSVCNPKFKV